MSFDSATFFLFFAVLWAVWKLLPHRAERPWLILCSLTFYGWWDLRYLPLIIGSATADYLIAGRIHRTEDPRRRRALVTLSLVVNLGLLGSFKYTPLLARTLNPILGNPWNDGLTELWVVPVGISFYTFQTLSYTIDVYRRQLKPARSFVDFLMYVSFFPQLVAGPIVRARTFLPQLLGKRRITAMRLRYGAWRVIQGLFLKVVVADGLAPAVYKAFAIRGVVNDPLSVLGAWYAAILFGVQLFADFAGYSGMAIGLASLMGFRFPPNFRAPYIAKSLSEYWGRWHISLSTWLRDYLYVPLGGNRNGITKTYRNLFLVMLLGGLWHGAGWNWAVWGAFHGLGLIVARSLSGSALARFGGAPGTVARWALTYAFVHVGYVMFRVDDPMAALKVVDTMLAGPFRELFGAQDFREGRGPHLRYLIYTIPVIAMHLAQLARERTGWRPSEVTLGAVSGLMLFALLITERSEPPRFFYFQF